jgi:hypothetical protein
MTGGSQWAAAYQKAKALVAQMTLEEQVSLLPRCPSPEPPFCFTNGIGITGECHGRH